MGEGLCRHQRLCRSVDFDTCYRYGEKKHGRLASVHWYPRDGGVVRLGVTVSRRVGNSVVRHRLKRQSREIFRRSPSRNRISSLDVVLHLKSGANRADFWTLAEEIQGLLASLESAVSAAT